MKEKSVIRPSQKRMEYEKAVRINNTNPLYNKKILSNRIIMKKQAVKTEVKFQK